jgi:hypothetical protein
MMEIKRRGGSGTNTVDLVPGELEQKDGEGLRDCQRRLFSRILGAMMCKSGPLS